MNFEFSSKSHKVTTKPNLIVFLTCLLFNVALSILFITATDKGVWIQSDVNSVWSQLIANNTWNDWHGVGFIFYCDACMRVFGRDISSVILVNGLLWIAINAVVLLYFFKVKKSNAGMVVYSLLNICFFSPYYYIMVMYKDTVFSIGFLGLTLFILFLLRGENISPWIILLGFPAMWLVMGARHGGQFGWSVAVIVTGIALLKRKNVKYLVYVVICLAMTLAFDSFVNYVGFVRHEAIENPAYGTYASPMYMVSAAAYEGVEFLPEDLEAIEQVATYEEWASFYNKYLIDDASKSWGKIGPERMKKVAELVDNEGYGMTLIRINWHLVTRHPVFYITHLADPSSIVWEIFRPADGYDWALVGVPEDENIEYHLGYKIVHKLGWFAHENLILNAICWRGGFALTCLLIVYIISLVKKDKDFAVAFAPILVWAFLLFMINQSQDTRYVLPVIEVSILAMAEFFSQRNA